MKSLRFYFLMIAGMLFLTTCKDKDREPDVLSVLPTVLTFSAEDTSEQTVAVTTNVSLWSYSGGDSWLDVYRKQDEKLYVKAQNYTNTESSRTSTITISAGDAKSVTVTVTQTAKEVNSLSVDPTSLLFEENEIGDKTVEIKTNALSWDATTDASWLTLSKQNNTLKVSVPAKNTGASDRSANIRITAGNAPELTFKVTQEASIYLTVDPESLSYGANETVEKTATISTNASSWSAATNASWITITKNGNVLKVKVNSDNTGNSARQSEIKITADKAPDAILKVTQSASEYPTPGKAEGIYYGDILGTGYAHFVVDMYNATDENVGFMIYGFCDMPSSASNFKITAGTYSVATTGRKNTFWPGDVSDDKKLYGTCVYNFNTNKFILVTGGTFTVALSGSTYTITTNFTGKDYSSGATVTNISLKYTGTIPMSIAQGVPPFGQIAKSSYSATGSYLFNVSGANYSSWNGVVTPVDGSKPYYSITNWGNKGITVRCHYNNGNISLDNSTKISVNSTYYGIFCMATYNSSKKEVTFYPYLTYYIKYNSTSKVLDFSGTYTGLPTCIGILAFYTSNNEVIGYINNVHLGPKLTLTSTSSAPMFSSEGAIRLGEVKDSDIVLFEDLKGYKVTIDNRKEVSGISQHAILHPELPFHFYKQIK